MKEHKKKTCPVCGGSGQISFFQGESRFLLTMEECLECNGTGIVENALPKGHRLKNDSKNHAD